MTIGEMIYLTRHKAEDQERLARALRETGPVAYGDFTFMGEERDGEWRVIKISGTLPEARASCMVTVLNLERPQ